MKNKLLLNTLRNVKNFPGRFIAIAAIIAISCAFYSGVQAACPDMKSSAWKYYDETSLADIWIKSTLGFNNGDAEKFPADVFDRAYEGYSADMLVSIGGGTHAVKLISYSKDQPLNKPYLVEGRLPEKSGECAVDSIPSGGIAFALGDKLSFYADDDKDTGDYLANREFTVVGIINSPLYVKRDRGNTDIGTGTLDAFAYIPEEDFSYEVPTDIFLSVKSAHNSGIEPFSKEYESAVSDGEYLAETLAESFLSEREQSVRDDFEEELAEARQELADGENDYEKGYNEYKDALRKYNNAYDELKAQKEIFAESEKELDDGAAELAENKEKLDRLADTCPQIDKFLTDYDGVYMEVLPEPLLNVFKGIQEAYDENDVAASISDLLAVYIITNPEKDQQSKYAAKAAIEGVNEQVRAAAAAALGEIEYQERVIEESREKLVEGRAAFDDYDRELADSKRELDKAQKEFEDARLEIDNAKAEIADGEAELEEKLYDKKWYVWNRGEFSPNCTSYGDDAGIIDTIAAVFPVFFILIAALVCCATMARMVEDRRTEAGTMKSLGYGSGSIIGQYVLYAAIASIIGSVIGVLIGFPLLPNIIYQCYSTMYIYPDFEAPFVPGLAAVCIAVSILCTGLSAVYTAAGELSAVPAMLIRPKPPKSGKRILLEKIGFIWKRMKFTSKVTFRNLLRYKSRFFMMIIGIGGCTALLLAAFGLKDSISCIAGKQYDDIFLYDLIAAVDEDASEQEREGIKSFIDESDVCLSSMGAVQEKADVSAGTRSYESYILSPAAAEELSTYIVLRDRQSHSPISLEDGAAVITEKLSKLLGVKAGDEINIEGASGPVKISAVTENYTYHYVYLNRSTFTELFGEKNDNIIFADTGGTPEKSVRTAFSESLMDNDGVLAASFSYDGAEGFRDLISSLNIIVAVIIAFAGALAFVILFNLANININERVRELATIKVLGFFNGEVAAYVYRENIVSAVIGMTAGLVVGIFFEGFIVSTAEVDQVMFSRELPLYCFAFSAAAMLIFIVFVNIVLYFKLKKIDMAASMKAIE